MRKLIYLFLFLPAFSACIPDPVEIEIPQAEPKLVLASQIFPDRIVIVNVSRSFGALEFQNGGSSDPNADSLFLSSLLVDSARVTLTYRDGTDTLAFIGAGTYLSVNTLLYENESYTLEVFDPKTGEQVVATSKVLPVVPLDEPSHTFIYDTLSLQGGLVIDTLLQLFLSWQDPAGDNYYMVNLYDSSPFDTLGPNGLLGLTGNQTTYSTSDKLFAGNPLRDTLTFRDYRPGDTVAVALSNISDIYYQYLTTRQRSGSSIFTALLKEPVSYPSNVEGGYGLFTMHLPSIRFLIL